VTLDGPVEVHEATNLSLSIEKAQARLGWSPTWDVHTSIRRTAAWYRRHGDGADALDLCRQDIAAYCIAG
jgi:CDP-glucose 4,6-dehydratase